MAYELRDQSGSLFKNDRKEKENHPDYTGTVMVNGVEMWISAWLKDSSRGKYMSLAFKPKEERREQPRPARDDRLMAAAGGRAPIDDDVPFAPEFR